LLRIVQKKILPTDWQGCSMETIRNKLVRHGASIELIDGICKIRLNDSFPYPNKVLQIIERLRQQVRIQQACNLVDKEYNKILRRLQA